MILHPIIDRLKTIAELLPTAIGGEFVPSGTKQISITENGTTTENVFSYADAEITVNVPTGITPTGTKQISITENGTTTEDVTNYANAEITVNVPSSGGMELLYETTPTTEQISEIKVDFTSDILGYDFYRIVLLGTFVNQPYPYVGINTETSTIYLNPVTGMSPGNSHWECYVAKLGTSYVSYLSSRSSVVSGDLSYFHARSYSAGGYFNTGFVIQIWGCNYENP